MLFKPYYDTIVVIRNNLFAIKKSLSNKSWAGSFYSGSYLKTFSNMQFSEG